MNQDLKDAIIRVRKNITIFQENRLELKPDEQEFTNDLILICAAAEAQQPMPPSMFSNVAPKHGYKC